MSDPAEYDAGDVIENYLSAASADGTRHAGCGQPWAYCFCGMGRRSGPDLWDQMYPPETAPQ